MIAFSGVRNSWLILARKADLVRDAASASRRAFSASSLATRISRALLRNTASARLMSPSSSGVSFGMRRIERAARHCDHAARQFAQPRDDIADDEEPDHQNGGHQAHERNRKKPESAILERRADRTLEFHRFLLGGLDKRVNLCLHVGYDMLQRQLQAAGDDLLSQFVDPKLKQAVLARAEIDELVTA